VTSLRYKTHPTVLTAGSFESQRINGRNGLLIRVNMSSLVSLLWSGGLFGRGGGQNYRLWNEMRTLQGMDILLALISRSWRKDYYPTILLEGFFYKTMQKSMFAKVTKQWLESHCIWVAEHPPHSPDLNPIEHVWKAMKSILRKDHRYLKDLKDNAASRRIFVVALRVAWWGVPQVIVDSLIDSMPKRYHAVRRNRGWYTKY